MNPVETYDLRETIRAVLEKYGLLENVNLEFDLMSAFNQYDRKADNEPKQLTDRKQATLTALITGANKNAEMEAEWTKLFGTTPNWKTKTNTAIMVWLKERKDHGETLEQFAKWWYKNDWRGMKGWPPYLNQIQETWGLAFSPVLTSKQGNLPEGL